MTTSLPSVSLVIPTLGRAEIVVDTVRYLLRQDYENWELIVVDQSDIPNEELLQLLKDMPVPARYYFVGFRGLPLARNFGWQHAEKDVVLYIDDDIECGPDFVRRHAEAHRERDCAFIAGGIREAGSRTTPASPGSLNKWTGDPIGNFAAPQAGPAVHGGGGNISFRRYVFARYGGFDEQLTVGAALYEELEFCLRLKSAGETGWFAPEAGLFHLAAPTGGCRVPRDWPRYMHGLAHNRAMIVFRYLSILAWPTALLRLGWLALAYSREGRSLRPVPAAVRGLLAGVGAARRSPVVSQLPNLECFRF